ncbi:hypothetical protein HN587_07560 [Candidatus Woesearchaeota archaeon]|jgi:predicted nucleotidyltransferase/uncharacterized protein (UPF0332 family)|nr:hypothetical protein [Candidatus Woesearchaeota archaeon]
MEIKTETPINPNIKKYSKEDFDIAHKFAGEMYKEFGKFIACCALFGSTARGEKKKGGDIDILIIVDDLRVNMNDEVVEAYRIITDQLVAKLSKDLHIVSLKLTSFWEYVRAGDPIAINILRDGVALIDNGFFDPVQALLMQGRIRPTTEAIWNYFARAPKTIINSKWHIMQAVVDLYWAVIDSSHAVLMKMGEIPPSPNHVADLLEERLVKHNLLDKSYVSTVREFYKLQKMITHREIKELRGEDFDKYLVEAQAFIKEMERIIEMGMKPKK